MARTSWTKGTPLERELQERLREVILQQGEKKTAEMLGVSVIAMTRAVTGLGLRRGTIKLIEIGLGVESRAA